MRRTPHAIAIGPLGDYVVAPAHAFDPIQPDQVNETYPLLKNHSIVAVGTKTECSRGLRLIEREQRARGQKIPLSQALKLLNSQPSDLSPLEGELVQEIDIRTVDNLAAMRVPRDTQAWVDSFESEVRSRCDSLTSARECTDYGIAEPLSAASANKILGALLRPYRHDLNNGLGQRSKQ